MLVYAFPNGGHLQNGCTALHVKPSNSFTADIQFGFRLPLITRVKNCSSKARDNQLPPSCAGVKSPCDISFSLALPDMEFVECSAQLATLVPTKNSVLFRLQCNALYPFAHLGKEHFCTSSAALRQFMFFLL